MKPHRPLSGFQLFSLCVTASMFGLFTGHSGALSPAYFLLVILLFGLQCASLALLSCAYKRTGGEDYNSMLSRALSRPAARVFLVFPGLLFILRASLTLSGQTEAVSLYLLEDTSEFAVSLVFLVTAFCALLPGIRRISGTAALFTLLLPVALGVVVVSGLLGADWGELRLLYQPAPDEFVPALIPALLTASGAECALFFLSAKNTKDHSSRRLIIAPAVCAAIFLCMQLVTVGTIGLGGLSSEAYPFIEASRQISTGTGSLTERLDFPFITVMLTASIIQIAIYTLCSALALKTVFCARRTGPLAGTALAAEFALSLLIRYAGLGDALQTVCALGIAVYTAVLIPLLALLAALRHRKERPA